jgi:hypothetical protein
MSQLQECGVGVPLFLTEADSPEEIALLELRWAARYLVLWLALGAVARACLVGRLPASKYKTEEMPLCMAQHIAGIIKCCVLIPTSNIAMYYFLTQPVAAGHLAYRMAEVAGVTVLASELADTLMIIVNRKLSVANFLHHSLYLAIGSLIRLNCAQVPVLAIATAGLVTQETSSVFLNWFLLWRNRGLDDAWYVKGSFICFTLCFFVWRLGMGSYVTFYYLTHMGDVPSGMPTWQVNLLGGAMVLGSGLQWYWGVFSITAKLAQHMPGKPKAKCG